MRTALGSIVAALALLAAADDARADAPRFGMMMDVGVPSGASGAVVYRPARAVRLHAGAGHNLVAPGVHGGVSLVPLATTLSPTLVVEAGRFFPGDPNAAVARVAGDADVMTLPDELAYDWASAHVGLEIGREWLTFYLHGGVSVVDGAIHSDTTAEDGSVSTTTAADVRAVGVSARVGLILYFAR